VLIRYANAGFVVEKTLASGLADAFSQHLPAWKPSATRCFFPRDFWVKQGHLRSRMSDVFSQSRASSLAKGCGSTAPAWLVQAQPCMPLSSSVPIWVIRGSQNDFAANDFSASTNEDHFLKSSLCLPVPITKSGKIQNFQRSVFLDKSRAYSGWLRTNSGERGFRGSFRLFAKPASRLSKGPTFWLF
jgi:hypothetical protein